VDTALDDLRASSRRRLREVAAIPHVIQAQRLFGDPDYLPRIVTTGLAAYQRLQDEKLSALCSVQGMTSTLVMKPIVNERPLPA
jgi:DNA-binding Lrp family transcriptional regulator